MYLFAGKSPLQTPFLRLVHESTPLRLLFLKISQLYPELPHCWTLRALTLCCRLYKNFYDEVYLQYDWTLNECSESTIKTLEKRIKYVQS